MVSMVIMVTISTIRVMDDTLSITAMCSTSYTNGIMYLIATIEMAIMIYTINVEVLYNNHIKNLI